MREQFVVQLRIIICIYTNTLLYTYICIFVIAWRCRWCQCCCWCLCHWSVLVFIILLLLARCSSFVFMRMISIPFSIQNLTSFVFGTPKSCDIKWIYLSIAESSLSLCVGYSHSQFHLSAMRIEFTRSLSNIFIVLTFAQCSILMI